LNTDNLKRLYHIDEDEDEDESEEDEEIEQQEEESEEEKEEASDEGEDEDEDEEGNDGAEEETDSDDSDSDLFDELQDEDEDVFGGEGEEVPLGDESKRIAIVNCDWSKVKAVDLLVILQSFIPTGGAIKSVTIYPSNYGIEQMKKEDLHGPGDVWKNDNEAEAEEEKREEEEEEEAPFDKNKLRK